MALLHERRVKTARLPDLLLHKIVPEAHYLEVVLHLGVDGDDRFAYLHQRHPRHRVYL